MEEKIHRFEINHLIAWLITTILLYALSLENYLLFHTLTELFSTLIAYIVFLIIWKTKGFISNRYLIFIGVVSFFVGSYDLLHTLTFKGLEIFPELNINISMQAWIIARYLESTSFLIASILLFQKSKETDNSIFNKNSVYIKKIFLIYSIITGCLFISVWYLKNFPTCYIEGLGVTPFKIISEYLISFMLLCSLIFLYKKKKRFEPRVSNLLIISILFTFLGELPFLIYSHINNLPSVIGHLFKIISFFYLYLAIVETGFDEPYNKLSRKVTQTEDALEQETAFFTNEQNLIYSLFGIKKNVTMGKLAKKLELNEGSYRSLIQNFSGILFQLNRDFSPILIEGSIEEITGYTKEDFLSQKVKWADLVMPQYLQIASKNIECISSKPKEIEYEYRIRRKNREIRWVTEKFKEIPGNEGGFLGSIHDITPRKNLEYILKKQENARLKEIHHRIKNNLQVISSLLDLQAEKFHDEDVIQAFKESQNRVISISLIHEELYESKDAVKLNFANYLQKLATDLLNFYTVKNQINLKLNLEKVYLEMDIAIPLGIIVNELISNSLKYAFQPGVNGEIILSLYRIEDYDRVYENYANSGVNREDKSTFQYVLVVADNGIGIPEEIDIENTDTLGLQIVDILIDQIEGYMELKRNSGTEFKISFND